MDHDTTAVIVWPVLYPLAKDAHCTIMYLGETKDIAVAPSDIIAAVPSIIPPLVEVTGFEVFGEDEKVWVATLNETYLTPLRDKIVERLERIGLENKSSFPIYRPHVTLAPYTGDDQEFAVTYFELGRPVLWWEDKSLPSTPQRGVDRRG